MGQDEEIGRARDRNALRGFALLGILLVNILPVLPRLCTALTIYTVQIVWSRLWLQRFGQGPMEALWRRWTYGGKQPVTGLPAAL